jgi:hypothetical protein
MMLSFPQGQAAKPRQTSVGPGIANSRGLNHPFSGKKRLAESWIASSQELLAMTNLEVSASLATSLRAREAIQGNEKDSIASLALSQ